MSPLFFSSNEALLRPDRRLCDQTPVGPRRQIMGTEPPNQGVHHPSVPAPKPVVVGELSGYLCRSSFQSRMNEGPRLGIVQQPSVPVARWFGRETVLPGKSLTAQNLQTVEPMEVVWKRNQKILIGQFQETIENLVDRIKVFQNIQTHHAFERSIPEGGLNPVEIDPYVGPVKTINAYVSSREPILPKHATQGAFPSPYVEQSVYLKNLREIRHGKRLAFSASSIATAVVHDRTIPVYIGMRVEGSSLVSPPLEYGVTGPKTT